MESLTGRRLQALARQLSTGAATPQAVTAPPDGHGNMEQQQHAPPERRLSEHEVAAFVRDGFCLVAVDQFTSAWHEAVHAKAHAISEETGHNQNVLWERLTPEINAVIRSRPVRGALHSLLGGDYLFSGGGHCHVAGPADQTHHKDGTSKGVREHEPRDVIVMYYAAETTVQMGATCVCPGTQYLAVDREGWYNSEERLPLHDACGRARRTGAALTGADSLSRWRAASAKAQLGTPPLATQGTADTTARQARLVEGLSSSLGLHPPRERRMVVPAGSLLVMHRDVFHRGGRAWPGATWRPMFKMGASRVSDPLPASASTSSVVPPLSAATTASALCAARANAWEWLHGLPAQPPVARPAARLPHPAAAVLQGAATEVERIEAAYLLASEGQVSVLLESLLSGGREACCRAACYGLRSTVRRGGAAADVAVATLVPRLAGSFVMAYGAVSGTPAILHCLGHATPALRTVQGLAALLPRLLGEIAALTTAQPLSRRRRWEKQGLLASRYQSEVAVEWGVADRRRAVAEACSALGGQGVGAVRQLRFAPLATTDTHAPPN
jgi:hypothetical protein